MEKDTLFTWSRKAMFALLKQVLKISIHSVTITLTNTVTVRGHIRFNCKLSATEEVWNYGL